MTKEKYPKSVLFVLFIYSLLILHSTHVKAKQLKPNINKPMVFPSMAESNSFMAWITDFNGNLIRVNLHSRYDNTDRNIGEFRRLLPLLTVDNKAYPCTVLGVRSECKSLPRYNFNRAFKYTEASYITGFCMDSIFVNPIPIIWTILGRGDNYDSDNDFSGNYVCAKRNSMIAKKLKKVSLIDLMTEDRINKFLSKYNGYAAHVYDWSFEHLKDTKESKYVISVLDALSLRRPNIECQGGRELHEDSCAGIFKYKSDKGFKGHAYCAYNHVATIVSPPFECTPLTIISKNATYIAAHISPYIGEFGGGIDGLYCLIPAAYNQKNIEIIRMVFSESKLGLTVASKMKSDNMTMFFGASKFKPSKILKHTFEYTTATFSATNNQGSIEVSGSIVLTVSAQNLDEQKSFLQPSNKQIEQYSTQVIDDLNIRFHKYYKKNNICDNSVIF